MRRTFLATGKAIIITSIILCGGFATLMLSSFEGTFHIGLLVSLTLCFAVVVDLAVLPLLAAAQAHLTWSHAPPPHLLRRAAAMAAMLGMDPTRLLRATDPAGPAAACP